MKNIQTTLILLTLISLAHSQITLNTNDAKIEFGGLTHKELAQRIFAGERNMIAGLRDTTPILETYLQSLWPNAKESPIDDAYFLSAVDFRRDLSASGYSRRGYQTFLFGGSPGSRKVRVNNRRKWKLFPDGYLDMMFVDIEDFDADTYDLNYLQKDTWAHAACLIFSVTPKDSRLGGKFKGQIWVETSTFKIVKIAGTFTVPPISFRKQLLGGKVPLYFRFESVREEVTPGYWLPSYTYFDENRGWQDIYHNGETDFHYRGNTFIWGYKNIDDQEPMAQGSGDSDVILRLEKDKLLATPGVVEQRLNAVARHILVASNIYVPDIKCRVLLTTPIEIFSVGHTIVLSRGLLNISPDESVIAVLLAREIANLMIGGSRISEPSRHASLFHEDGMKDFEGFGIYESSQKDATAWTNGLILANRAGYTIGIGYTSLLLSQLVQHSKHIPNLVEARFGRDVLDMWKTAPVFQTAQASTTLARPLLLRGKYFIDSWTGGIEVQPGVVSRAAALDLVH